MCLCLCLCAFLFSEDKDRIDSNMVAVCNDGNELSNGNFFWFTPKDETSSCSMSEILVCKAYRKLFSTLGDNSDAAVDWDAEPLSSCKGPAASGLPPEDFMVQSGDSSDLYRYLLMYIILWNITFLTLTLLFFYIKYSSKMDSIFHLPSSPKQNPIFKFFRVFSPFDR